MGRELTVYRAAVRLAHRLPLPAGKLAASVSGRREAAERWRAWAAAERGDGPLIWFHGASVGELSSVEPLLPRLKTAIPELRVVESFSSPSAVRWPRPTQVGYADYLPADEPDAVSVVLDAVHPCLIGVARGELWPELVTRAAQRRIPLAVLGGAIRASSPRLRWPARGFYRRLVRSVTWVGAVSEVQAARWRGLGVPSGAVEVTGDPRHDQVLERLPDFGTIRALVDWAGRGPVLVAGSTDRRDEAVLLRAAAIVLRQRPGARVLLVPHEPSAARAVNIVAKAGALGIAAEPWAGHDPTPASRCVAVAALGALFDLYALGAVAYVGGGFRSAVHAVIEPAAWAIPVIVGPRPGDDENVQALQAAGGAARLPARRPADALAAVWSSWLDDEGARSAAGLAARDTLTPGAADRTVRRLVALLSDR